MVWRYRCFDRCFGLVPEKVTQLLGVMENKKKKKH